MGASRGRGLETNPSVDPRPAAPLPCAWRAIAPGIPSRWRGGPTAPRPTRSATAPTPPTGLRLVTSTSNPRSVDAGAAGVPGCSTVAASRPPTAWPAGAGTPVDAPRAARYVGGKETPVPPGMRPGPCQSDRDGGDQRGVRRNGPELGGGKRGGAMCWDFATADVSRETTGGGVDRPAPNG